MNRYEVTISRKVIVYGETLEEASNKALNLYQRNEPDNWKTSEVKLLPPLEEEKQLPIIDCMAPVLQRKFK